jgi:hypothetical protein
MVRQQIETPLGDDSLLTRRQLAEVLGVGVRSLERYTRLGMGPRCIRISPRRVSYRLGDVRDFIRSGV